MKLTTHKILTKHKIPEYPLSEFIQSLSITKGNKVNEVCSGKNLPSGYFVLMFNLGAEITFHRYFDSVILRKGDAAFFGQTLKSWNIELPEDLKLLEVRFHPWAIPQISNYPMSESAGKVIDPIALFGNGINDLKSKLLNSELDDDSLFELVANYLNDHLNLVTLNPGNSIIKNITSKIFNQYGFISVKEVAEELKVSRRTIEVAFKNNLGITVTHFSRKVRLRNVAKVLSKEPDINYTGLTYACGYFDQSHFIHDFKKITDLSPKQFFETPPFVEDFFIKPITA